MTANGDACATLPVQLQSTLAVRDVGRVRTIVQTVQTSKHNAQQRGENDMSWSGKTINGVGGDSNDHYKAIKDRNEK